MIPNMPFSAKYGIFQGYTVLYFDCMLLPSPIPRLLPISNVTCRKKRAWYASTCVTFHLELALLDDGRAEMASHTCAQILDSPVFPL